MYRSRRRERAAGIKGGGRRAGGDLETSGATSGARGRERYRASASTRLGRRSCGADPARLTAPDPAAAYSLSMSDDASRDLAAERTIPASESSEPQPPTLRAIRDHEGR